MTFVTVILCQSKRILSAFGKVCIRPDINLAALISFASHLGVTVYDQKQARVSKFGLVDYDDYDHSHGTCYMLQINMTRNYNSHLQT